MKYTRGTAVRISIGLAIFGLTWPVPSGYAGKGGKGNNQDKVAVCHKGRFTLYVAQSAVDAHLGHGDTLGPCDVTPNQGNPGNGKGKGKGKGN